MLKRATTNANQSAATVFTWTKVPNAARSGLGPRVMVRPTSSPSGRTVSLLFLNPRLAHGICIIFTSADGNREGGLV